MKCIKPVLVVTYEMVMSIVLALPRYKILLLVKKYFLSAVGAKIGRGVVIYPGVWITPGRNLVIDDEVDLARDVIITTSGGVSIGKRTLVGYRSQILSANHRITQKGIPFPVSGDVYKPVIIGADVWIGANCVITPGVTLGDGVVVAAGSVVTHDFAAFSIIGGVPAKVIKMRV